MSVIAILRQLSAPDLLHGASDKSTIGQRNSTGTKVTAELPGVDLESKKFVAHPRDGDD